MKNKHSSGEVLTRVAPAGGVVSGSAYLIGTLLVVAVHDAAAGENFACETTGVFSLPKNNAQAWTVGQKLWWDDAAKQLDTTNVAGAAFHVGSADTAQLAADTEGRVRLDGVSRAAG